MTSILVLERAVANRAIPGQGNHRPHWRQCPDVARTVEQLESNLPAADLTLPTDVLDRIDELVPGVALNPDDNSYGDRTLTPAARRR